MNYLREITRRHFFANSGVSLGSLGSASLLSEGKLVAVSETSASVALGDAVPTPVHPQVRRDDRIHRNCGDDC